MSVVERFGTSVPILERKTLAQLVQIMLASLLVRKFIVNLASIAVISDVKAWWTLLTTQPLAAAVECR